MLKKDIDFMFEFVNYSEDPDLIASFIHCFLVKYPEKKQDLISIIKKYCMGKEALDKDVEEYIMSCCDAEEEL